MSRNHLKHFPTAVLRRGLAHFHPVAWPSGRGPTASDPPAQDAVADPRVVAPPAPPTAESAA